MDMGSDADQHRPCTRSIFVEVYVLPQDPGTTMDSSSPIAYAPRPPQAVPEPLAMKVLVVDDHALIREGVAQMLKRLGDSIEVLQAGSCEDAFTCIEACPEVGLVLMDLHLPGMQGDEGLGVLRSRYPELPVVVVSGSRDRETVLRTIRLGAMGFIPKTHSSDLLLGALEFVLLHRGIYLPPDVFLQDDTLPPRSNSPQSGSKLTRPQDLGLTVRQAEVLYLVLQGKSNKLICRELDLSEGTVKTHLTAVLRALNVTTRTEAVVAANRLRLVFDGRSG